MLTHRIVEAGLTLIAEAEKYAKCDFRRAQDIRNGLMIIILGLTQICLKNFVVLEIGYTFKEIDGSWWVSVPSGSTKNKRWVEKRIPNGFHHAIDLYLKDARSILMRSPKPDDALWISRRTGSRFTYKNLGTLISKITLRTLGVDVSPHLFRTAAASTAAVKLAGFPHLPTALLSQADPRIADEHYKRTTSLAASNVYGDLIQEYLTC